MADTDQDQPEGYDAMTVQELHDLCQERELPVSGSKAELIDRLTADDAAADDDTDDDDPDADDVEVTDEGEDPDCEHDGGFQTIGSVMELGRYTQVTEKCNDCGLIRTVDIKAD